MEKAKNPEATESDLVSGDGNNGERDDAVEAKPAEPVALAASGELPVEPPLVWETPAEDKPKGAHVYDPARARADLLSFFLRGHAESARSMADEDWPTPASIYPYRDLSHHRYDYPLCLDGDDPESGARPLADIVDGLLVELVEDVEDDEDGVRMRRHVFRLEALIKSHAARTPGVRLSDLWDRSAKELLSTKGLTEQKKRALEEDLSRARGALTVEGDVVPCSTKTPTDLFVRAARMHWRRQCAEWRDQLDVLIAGLQDILAVDFENSPEAKSPEHLRETMAPRTGEEIDASALADLLGSSELAPTLSQARRDRVRATLNRLLDVKPLYDPDVASAGSIRVDAVFEDTASALDEYDTRMVAMVKFFMAVRVARLEIANGYRSAVHGPFFARFDATYLNEDEIAVCPPVLLRIKSASVAETDPGLLLQVLGSDKPIKVLLQLDDIYREAAPGRDQSILAGWAARLASIAVAFNHVYVMQTPVSKPTLLHNGYLHGIGYPGPALFSVYAGAPDRSRLSTYLDAAAATESRCLPVFVFDPSRGDRMIDRIDVRENPQCEADWAMGPFPYRTDKGDIVTEDIAYTPADLFFCDRDLASHFWCVPPEQWHESMVPLKTYLDLDAESITTRVPYILTVSGDERLGRAVMTQEIVMAVLRCRSFWHQIQEIGGVNNSFALALLEKEKERLAEEKRREVEEIENNYVTQIDQDLGELTKEIVQRIANQLVAGSGNGSDVMFAPPPAAPAPEPVVEEEAPVAEEAPAPAVEEEEDEEMASLDDPYIDTPLCTTCNECTKLNAQIFAYNANKQAEIKNPTGGPYKDLVRAAELCPVHIIHPGKPKDMDEPDLDQWVERAAPFI